MASGRPTVYDVAARAGVSIATVSFAFRRPEKVRPETRDAVLAVARELGYAPSGPARSLAHGRTGVLGLHLFDLILDHAQDGALPDDPAAHQEMLDLNTLDLDADLVPWQADEDARQSDPHTFPLYVDEVQRGFVLECKRNGRAVLLSTGGADISEVADTAGRVDGLAVFPGRTAMASIESVAANLPLVVLSSREGVGHHRVLVDNVGGMRSLVRHLVTVHGANTLGWVGAPEAHDYIERHEVFVEESARVGVTAQLVDATDLESAPEFVNALERAKAGTLPDALVCASDQVALALMQRLQAIGVHVPEDVLVTGFDGVLAGRMSTPTLTTVRQPMELMGRVAAHLLLTDSGDGADVARTVTLETSLRLGGSCGC